MAATSPGKRRGAPAGNQNARTHGFYSQYFPPKDQQDLEESSFDGLSEEINMIRVYMRHIVRAAPKQPSFAEAVEIARILCLATASLTRLMRVQKYIQGDNMGRYDKMIDEAIAELTAEFSISESSSA